MSLQNTGDDLGYTYPHDLDLRPGQPLHGELLNWLNGLIKAGKSAMRPRYSDWEEIDRTITDFVVQEAKQVSTGKKRNEPTRREIIVPVIYSILDTLLSHISMSVLDVPLYRYEGVGPEDVPGALLLEEIVKHQTIRNKHLLSVYVMFRNALLYGVSPVMGIWEKDFGLRPEITVNGEFNQQGQFNATGYKKTLVEDMIYEGNKLYNIDPYNYIPDPNVPVQRVNEGEYVGWMSRTNRYELLEKEDSEDSGIFNVEYISEAGARSPDYYADHEKYSVAGQVDVDHIPGSTQSITGYQKASNPVDVAHLYVRVIPESRNLGDGTKPERWYFAVAGNELIISARRVKHPYNTFPVLNCAPDYSGFDTSPISRLEVNFGLQKAVDFYHSSHIANVRRAVDDSIVVDQSRINLADLLAPGPAKVVRTRRNAWGSDIRKSIFQLQINDITRNNVPDANALIELMYRGTGATEAMQGMPIKRGERVSATEMRGTFAGSAARIDRFIKVAALMTLTDLGFMFGANTQYHMSREQYIKISGRHEHDIRKIWNVPQDTDSVRVDPLMLDSIYDVVPLDLTSPSPDQGELGMRLLQVLSTQPELYRQFHVQNIVANVLRSSGMKDVFSYMKTDEEVEQSRRKDLDGQLELQGAKQGSQNSGSPVQ